MQEENTKFFKVEEEKLEELSLPNELVLAFSDENTKYFFIKADSYLSNDFLDEENEDLDLENEYQKILPKLENQSNELVKLGFTQLTFDEFKLAKKEMTDKKERSYLSHLNDDEMFVHEKIKSFIELYDIKDVSQKKFIIGLRNSIVTEDSFSEFYLEERAELKQINIDELFDISNQLVIVEFMNEVANQLKEKRMENTNKKLKF